MRVLILAFLVAPASTALLRRTGKVSRACMKEQKNKQEPEPSRGNACDACFQFQEAHADSKHVQPNAHMCRVCYSVKSSCDSTKFAWSCYDENQQFEVMKKQGSDPRVDEPDEMLDEFKNKEPEMCQ